MRNLKIGQQVLDYIAEHLDGMRLLEEPTTDEMTTRRVNYYRRNGYEISFDHEHSMNIVRIA